MLSHSSWFSNSPVPRTCARPMQPLSGRPHSSWPSLATAGQPGFAPRGCSVAQEGPCPQTHVCMSRCSAHCTETMPSKGECSHTTPQVPSRPTTNCNSRQGEQASGSALHSSRLAPGQGPWPLLRQEGSRSAHSFRPWLLTSSQTQRLSPHQVLAVGQPGCEWTVSVHTSSWPRATCCFCRSHEHT